MDSVEAPGGPATVTLVLTDVEGSTRLWAEHPTVMNAVMARHHEIVHAAVTAHGGWRPVDQGEGDAVFAAFDAPTQAIAAVTQFQQELAAQAWPPGITVRDRVGVHIGEVTIRDGNIFGSTVNRCARLRGLGAGGQVLLSAPVFELVRDQLPEGVTTVDLGEHRMKDLTRAEHVHQLVVPGLRADFPPLASLDRAQHNLTVQTSSFLGREREISELTDLVTRERLATITGFGGMGKTRLALQVAAELATGDGDGVWFVDLSTETDADRVSSLLNAVLHITEGPDGALSALLDGLRDRRLLLVLDNLEQLLPGIATLVDALARSGPGVRILATCREPLRVGGEQEYVLDPLPSPPIPAVGAALSEAEVARLPTYAAVSLFLARATAARQTFTLTAGNAAAVAAICARLDGLPLALELAAARTRSLSPEALLPRLDNALKILTGGDRTLPTRHQTLTATISSSYDALAVTEQQLLDRLSVFAGTFTLDAAEAICGPAVSGGEDDLDVLDGIGVLVDRSLLRHHPTSGEQAEDRYGLLTTIRAYAAAQLEQVGEAGSLAARHADFYRRLATMPLDATRETYSAVNHRRAQEEAQLSLALEWQHTHGTADDELAVVCALSYRLVNGGNNAEMRRIGERALASPSSSLDRVRVSSSLTIAEMNSGQWTAARRWSKLGLFEGRAATDKSVLADHQTVALGIEGSRARTSDLLHETLAILKSLPERGNRVPPWLVTANLEGGAAGLVYCDPGWAEAAIRRAVHSDLPGWWEQYNLSVLGFILVTTGQLGEAATVLAPFEPDGGQPDWAWVARINGLSAAVELRLATGEFGSAAADLDGLEQLAAANSASHRCEVTVQRAVLDELTGHPDRALRRLAAVEADVKSIDDQLWASVNLGLARLYRGTGDHRSARRALDRSWAAVAGQDARQLITLLGCLLEGATQLASQEPRLAAVLLGLVEAHRGPFRLDVLSDPTTVLRQLRDRLGGADVDRVLAATAAQPLPEDRDWESVLILLRRAQ